MIHPTKTTELEGLQDSILPAIKTALATTTQLLGKPHNVCLTGWPAADVEKWIGGLLASPVFKLLLYDAQCCIETPLLWPTGTWLLLHSRELKEETTIDLDAVAVLIEHEGTTSIVPVHLGLKTPGRLAGAGSRGYGPETSYNRALMLAVPMKPTIATAVHD